MTIQRAKEILQSYDKNYSDEEIMIALEFLESLISLLPEFVLVRDLGAEKSVRNDNNMESKN